MRGLLILFLSIWPLTGWSVSLYNLNKEGFALDGFDPITYFKLSKPIKGNSKFQVAEKDATYRFISEENKNIFLKEPNKYKPQFGGWCAYAVADSKSKVEVDPQSFIIQDGKLLVFYNGFFGDTKSKWQKTNNKSPARFLEEASKNWPEIKDKEP